MNYALPVHTVIIKPETRYKTQGSGFQVFIVAVTDNGTVAVAKADSTPHNDCIIKRSCINFNTHSYHVLHNLGFFQNDFTYYVHQYYYKV